MAQLQDNGGGDHGKGKKKRPKKGGTHIDMTPMVDLAFLLLTFFVLTATFSKPNAMQVSLPKKPTEGEKPKPIPAERTYNLLLDKDNALYWYQGEAADIKGGKIPTLTKVGYGKDGIRKFLAERNNATLVEINKLKNSVKEKTLADSLFKKEVMAVKEKYVNGDNATAPIILIKASNDAKFENFVDVLDEMNISFIATFSIADISGDEVELLKQQTK